MYPTIVHAHAFEWRINLNTEYLKEYQGNLARELVCYGEKKNSWHLTVLIPLAKPSSLLIISLKM